VNGHGLALGLFQLGLHHTRVMCSARPKGLHHARVMCSARPKRPGLPRVIRSPGLLIHKLYIYIYEFVAACPCPDGLMQDGTQEGNETYVISHQGARSRGYKRRERARARERERERERERVPACVHLVCPASHCQRVST
jgi:hypothetical protein